MKHTFGIAVEVEHETGDILSVYFQIRKGKSAETREVDPGKVFVDYSASGQLLGIEMLAPSRIAVLDKITQDEPESQRFVSNKIPREMALV